MSSEGLQVQDRIRKLMMLMFKVMVIIAVVFWYYYQNFFMVFLAFILPFFYSLSSNISNILPLLLYIDSL